MSWGCAAPKNKGKIQYGAQGTAERTNLKELLRKCMEGTGGGGDIGKTSWIQFWRLWTSVQEMWAWFSLEGAEHSIGLSRAQIETLRFVLFLLFSWLSLSSLFGQDWIDLWKEFYFKQGRSSRRSLKRKSSQNTKKRRKFSRILCILSRKRKDTCITSSCRQKLYKVMWSFYFLFSYKTNLCTFMTV